jgi:chromosome segregation ATPase
VSARQLHEKPGTRRAGGRGKRKQLAELRRQLAIVRWRLSVLEQRVGTTPDLAQLDREITQEWDALPSLSDEVERLRDVLRRHDIDPQDGAA